ncbi:hypothetical protein SAMN05216525_1649 [Bradyrhizobium sp. Gha]|nr:hypothetical protein SAMN05216525_1649 [Bradyrhizobium sp. Gha]
MLRKSSRSEPFGMPSNRRFVGCPAIDGILREPAVASLKADQPKGLTTLSTRKNPRARSSGWRGSSLGVLPLLPIGLLGRRTALVTRQTFDVRGVLLLDGWILLAGACANGLSRLGGWTILVAWLAGYAGTRILRARSAGDVRLRRLSKCGGSRKRQSKDQRARNGPHGERAVLRLPSPRTSSCLARS